MKLCLNIRDEHTNSGKDVRLVAQGDCPEVVSVIIKKNNIVFIARTTEDRRRPNV